MCLWLQSNNCMDITWEIWASKRNICAQTMSTKEAEKGLFICRPPNLTTCLPVIIQVTGGLVQLWYNTGVSSHLLRNWWELPVVEHRFLVKLFVLTPQHFYAGISVISMTFYNSGVYIGGSVHVSTSPVFWWNTRGARAVAWSAWKIWSRMTQAIGNETEAMVTSKDMLDNIFAVVMLSKPPL